MFEVSVKLGLQCFVIRDNLVRALVDRMRNLMPYFTNNVTKIEYLNLTQIEYLRFMSWFLEAYNNSESESEFVDIIQSHPEVFFIEDKITITYGYDDKQDL